MRYLIKATKVGIFYFQIKEVKILCVYYIHDALKSVYTWNNKYNKINICAILCS